MGKGAVKRPASKRHRHQEPPLAGDEPSLPLLSNPLDIKEALAGETEADNKRHGIARAAFMNILLEDERVRSRFQSWRHQFGLDKRLRACGAASSTADLERATRDLHRALRGLRKPLLASEALTFVRDTLHLPWAWLVLDLIEAFLMDIGAEPLRRFGGRLQARITVDSDPSAPSLEVPAFATALHESAKEARERLLQHMLPAYNQLTQAMKCSLPKGRVRGDYAEYARWFYRVRVAKQNGGVSAIAREYHARAGHTCEGDDRKTVRDGINAAARALGLGQYELLPRDRVSGSSATLVSHRS